MTWRLARPGLPIVVVVGLATGLVAVGAVASSAASGEFVPTSAGGFHTCALTTAGGVKCWGRNGNGQLGDSTLTDRAAARIRVGTPSVPTGVSSIPGIGTETIQWTAPKLTNKAAITGYKVTVAIGSSVVKSVSVGRLVTKKKFTGLNNGQIYTFAVAAENARGLGPSSSVTASPGTPIAPTRVRAGVYGGSVALVHWTAPKVTNRAAVTGYVVTAYSGGIEQLARSFAGALTTESIKGLKAEKTYRFKVAAENARGTGPLSAASNPVRPCGRVAGC